jgi:hypothetical protein
MTPQQESLSGVIICPALGRTAVKGELLHHASDYYTPGLSGWTGAICRTNLDRGIVNPQSRQVSA